MREPLAFPAWLRRIVHKQCDPNPPLANDRLWAEDRHWGALGQEPEVLQVFEEHRRRIGPVYGTLHYFPGW